MKGDQNLKEALKEVLSEIGQCFKNAQRIDKRMKEKAGDVKLEEEKRKDMEGHADITALARALGFEVEDADDDDDRDSSDDSSDPDDENDDTDDEDGEEAGMDLELDFDDEDDDD